MSRRGECDVMNITCPMYGVKNKSVVQTTCCKDLVKIAFQRVELNETHIIYTCLFHYAVG